MTPFSACNVPFGSIISIGLSLLQLLLWCTGLGTGIVISELLLDWFRLILPIGKEIEILGHFSNILFNILPWLQMV